MLKKIFIILSSIFLLMGCINNDQTKNKGFYEAKMLISFENYYNNLIDKGIYKFQDELKLNFEQTEILYLMKSDLLAKIPAIRQLLLNFQLKLIDTIKKDKITSENLDDLFNEIDLYKSIARDTFIKRIIELHSTLDQKQKEILAMELEKNQIFFFPPPPPMIFPSHQFIKASNFFIKEIALTMNQKRILMNLNKEIKKELMNQFKLMKKDESKQKEIFKALILSEKIDILKIDEIFNNNVKHLDVLKKTVYDKLIELHNTLSTGQKELLIKTISQ